MSILRINKKNEQMPAADMGQVQKVKKETTKLAPSLLFYRPPN